MIPEDRVNFLYPDSDKSKATMFWMAICLQHVPLEKICLYESTFPRWYTAIVFVRTTSTEQHSWKMLIPESCCTASMFGCSDSAMVKMLAGIHYGGVWCDYSSKIISTIHSIQAFAPPHPMEFGRHSFLITRDIHFIALLNSSWSLMHWALSFNKSCCSSSHAASDLDSFSTWFLARS